MFWGILTGIDKNIRHLTLNLTQWSMDMGNFDESFPLLSTVTLITHRRIDNCYIQGHMIRLLKYFPVMNRLYIKNDATLSHCDFLSRGSRR